MKDLKELATKYGSLTDIEKIEVEESAYGKVTSSWFSNRPEEINNLIECNWFYLYEFGIDIGGDGRLRLKEEVISRVPEDEPQRNLKSASDFIADYFSTAAEYIEHPDQANLGETTEASPEGGGMEEFLVGLIEGRRS